VFLKAAAGDDISLYVAVQKGGELLERLPHRGAITVAVPPPDFEEKIWT